MGLTAWDAYIERLRALQEADEETRKGDMLGNSWIYECLAQYRGAAAQYLRDVASEFDSRTANHLIRAADPRVFIEQRKNGLTGLGATAGFQLRIMDCLLFTVECATGYTLETGKVRGERRK